MTVPMRKIALRKPDLPPSSQRNWHFSALMDVSTFKAELPAHKRIRFRVLSSELDTGIPVVTSMGFRLSFLPKAHLCSGRAYASETECRD